MKKSEGAKAVFADLPNIQELSLIFYRIQTQVTPDLKGHYIQQRTAKPVARFSLSRAKSYDLDPKRAIAFLKKPPECIHNARGLLDELWVSTDVQFQRAKIDELNAQYPQGLKPKKNTHTVQPSNDPR